MKRSAVLSLILVFVSNAGAQPKPRREGALPSKDAAKMFSEETWKAVRAAGDRLIAEKDTDFLIDTVETPPKIALEQFRKMTYQDKEKHFQSLVAERAKAEKLQGVYILICKSPNFFYVGTTGDAHFPSSEGSKIRTTIGNGLKDKGKDRDEALLKAVTIALEAKGLGEKK